MGCGDTVEGNFANYGYQQLSFEFDMDSADTSSCATTSVTITVSGANLTLTDSTGTIALYLSDDTGTVTIDVDETYTVTVWQTDTDEDDWEVSMTCSLTCAPTSEPTATAFSANFGAAMAARLNEEHHDIFGMKEDVTKDNTAGYQNVEISLSPFAIYNLWAMAVFVSCVIMVLVVCCIRGKTVSDEGREECQFAISHPSC